MGPHAPPGSDQEAEPAAKAAAPAVKKAPEKPKKPPPKPLPQLMEEDLIPSLKATLEAQEDVSQIELSFRDNRLEGSFLKKDIPYNFWAFFPNGELTGPKAFSLSSYGYEASTVEPFLIDERRVSAQLVVFWIRKRLAAQGILPVWKE
ncbi:putative Serine/threonine-protein kinase STE20 [Cocos nucifera]|nr:putative Serine/threonine-protein kinase STE20 [Cocos nucifera]